MTEHEKDIMYNFGDSTENFFLWIEEVCGIHREREIFKYLQMAVTSQESLDVFISMFDGDFEFIDRTVSKYMAARVA